MKLLGSGNHSRWESTVWTVLSDLKGYFIE
jgi:hypothetical protein